MRHFVTSLCVLRRTAVYRVAKLHQASLDVCVRCVGNEHITVWLGSGNHWLSPRLCEECANSKRLLMSLLSMQRMRPWGCWVMRRAKRFAGEYGMYCQKFPFQLGCWLYTGKLDSESLLAKYGVAKSLVLPVSTVRAVTQVRSLRAATALEEVLGFTRIGEEERRDGEAIALHKTHICFSVLCSVLFKETPGLDVLQHSTHVTEQDQPNLPPAKKLSRAKRKAAQRVQAKLS